jgi:cephamycin C biosynthesis protein
MTLDGHSSTTRDVNTNLIYCKALPSNDVSERWFININASSNGKREQNFENEIVPTTIHDIRGYESDTHIDVTGFQTLHSPSTVDADLILNGTEEQVKKIYYGEVEQLLKRVTGANHIIFFDHTVRKMRPDQLDNSPSNRQPVLRVHVDQTPISAHTRVKRHGSHVLWKRFQLINVWRPLKNPVYDYPLAVADFRSINVLNDLIPTTLVYPPPLPNGETYSVVYNPQHRWCYWSQMTPDEVMLLKCYDSASRALSTIKKSGAKVDETLLRDVAGLTPHTAFYDEQGAKEGPARQSIEVRALVFYD